MHHPVLLVFRAELPFLAAGNTTARLIYASNMAALTRHPYTRFRSGLKRGKAMCQHQNKHFATLRNWGFWSHDLRRPTSIIGTVRCLYQLAISLRHVERWHPSECKVGSFRQDDPPQKSDVVPFCEPVLFTKSGRPPPVVLRPHSQINSRPTA